MDNLIDGNAIAKEVLEELAQEVATLPSTPKVVFIRVGENPASISYIAKKQKASAEIGIDSEIITLPESITEKQLLDQIQQLNNNPDINGILVQAPLPKHISDVKVFNAIDPKKDVDGFNATNLGKIAQDQGARFVTCTPAGILEIFKRLKIQTTGKNIVIVGRSLIVGRPLELLLSGKSDNANATVTVCHSKTTNIDHHLKNADIVIAALGKPKFITKDMLKNGVVVIDVGINRIVDCDAKNGCRIVGDVDFKNVQPMASQITPVPGGVGPMTVAMLMKNTVLAYKIQHEG